MIPVMIIKNANETLSEKTAVFTVKGRDWVRIPANSDELILYRQATVFQVGRKFAK